MPKYNGISMPKNLLDRIDRVKKKYGFTTKADFIRQSVRNELYKLEIMEIKNKRKINKNRVIK